MDDVFDKLKKACPLDPDWLLDDQKSIPTFFSEVILTFSEICQSGNLKPC